MTTTHEAEEVPERPAEDLERTVTVVRMADSGRNRTIEYGVIGTPVEGAELLAATQERAEGRLVELVPLEEIEDEKIAAHSLHRWMHIKQEQEPAIPTVRHRLGSMALRFGRWLRPSR
jgi:hypothetical protein